MISTHCKSKSFSACKKCDVFNNENWELSDELLSEGTKAQIPKDNKKLLNNIQHIPLSTKNLYEVKDINLTFKESYDSSWDRSPLRYKQFEVKKNSNKLSMAKSTKIIKKLTINESNTGEEFKQPLTLKDEITMLLRMLSTRRSEWVQKELSNWKINSKQDKRNWALSNVDFSKPITEGKNDCQLIASNQMSSYKNIEEVTMDQILPNLEIDSLF